MIGLLQGPVAVDDNTGMGAWTSVPTAPSVATDSGGDGAGDTGEMGGGDDSDVQDLEGRGGEDGGQGAGEIHVFKPRGRLKRPPPGVGFKKSGELSVAALREERKAARSKKRRGLEVHSRRPPSTS